ncbi:minor capsid protein [Companilactobacillus sp.]|uniref:minor capsid protein n=1 Tax=Companilactobacillus sp. TaxID=2767905 RepID=UPI00262EE7DC|nr:minor capsid protein [Companilactobacillus sp.]
MAGYWEKREREWINSQQEQDIDFDKQIDKIYNSSLDKIDKDISQFYTRYASKEGITIDEAKKKVAEFNVKDFQSTAKKMVEERDFSDEANERLRIYNATMRINRLEMLKAQIGIDLLEETDEISDTLRNRLVTELKAERVRQAGILGETVPKMTERRMEELIDGSYHGAKFSERIWTNQDVLKNELDTILTCGLVMGMNPDQLSTRLRSLIGDKVRNASYAASRIARTESARIAELYSRELYGEYGFHKLKWIAEPTACSICRPMDNKIFDLHGKNAPDIPAHPNCRCSTVPVDDEENEPPTPKEREQQKDTQNGVKETQQNGTGQTFSSKPMRDEYGDERADGFEKIINSPDFDPRLKKAFDRYQNDFEFNTISDKKTPYSSRSGVYLNNYPWDGSSHSKPYQVVFHEMGHAIDYLSTSKFYEDGLAPTGRIQSTRIAGHTYKNPVKTTYISGSTNYNFSNAIKEDMDNAIYGEPSENVNYYHKQEKKKLFMDNLKAEVNKLPPEQAHIVYGSYSDMLGSTGEFGAFPLGVGHKATYWRNKGSAATEFVAHMTESVAANPEALQVLEKYMPKTTKEYWKLIQDINKE